MDTKKLLDAMLSKQGITSFMPISNMENCYGYKKENEDIFVICDENLNPLPYEDRSIIVKRNSDNYEICQECPGGDYCWIVNKEGKIVRYEHFGARVMGDGTIVAGRLCNLDLSYSCVLKLRNAYCNMNEVSDNDERLPTLIDETGFIKDHCFVAKTPLFDIFAIESEANKQRDWDEEKEENKCLIKKKDGTIVAEEMCCYIWVHQDNSLDIISSPDGKTCKVQKVSREGRIYGNTESIKGLYENEKYYLTFADEYNNYQQDSIEVRSNISDKYILMECVRIDRSREREMFALNDKGLITDSVTRDAKVEYISDVQNNILIIKETHTTDYDYNENDDSYSEITTSWHNYYDISDMEKIAYSDGQEEYLLCEKNCGQLRLKGVLRKWDCKIIVPICFHEVEIYKNLFFVTIERNAEDGIKKDIGVYSSDGMLVPIGMCDSYREVSKNYIIEYTYKGKKGVVVNARLGNTEISDAKYDAIDFEIEVSDDGEEYVLGAFTSINRKKGYLYFNGGNYDSKPELFEIKAQYRELAKIGFRLFLANGNNVLHLNNVTGKVTCIAELQGHNECLSRGLTKVFKNTITEELHFLKIDWDYNSDICPEVEQISYEKMNGFVRLSNGAVYFPSRNKFVSKNTKDGIEYPPEELKDLKEIMEWKSSTSDTESEETSYNNKDYSEDTQSYNKYGGYNGFDDDTIDSAFEGDPSLTWNID